MALNNDDNSLVEVAAFDSAQNQRSLHIWGGNNGMVVCRIVNIDGLPYGAGAAVSGKPLEIQADRVTSDIPPVSMKYSSVWVDVEPRFTVTKNDAVSIANHFRLTAEPGGPLSWEVVTE